MLKNIATFFFCLCLGSLQAYETERQKDFHQENGRYQISTNSDNNRTEIYLLDTRNGKVWMTGSKGFGYYHSWSRLPTLPIEEE